MKKNKLVALCNQHIQVKLVSIETKLNELNESLQSETKSSVGDKYETSRALLHQEIDQLKAQLQYQNQLLLGLSKTLKENCDKVEEGALVMTDQISYFICVPLGKIYIDSDVIQVVSKEAPLVVASLGLSRGDSFQMNQKKIKIIDIF